MTSPFIGQIQIFPYNFPPRGWVFCSGQTISIAQNTALFSLLGTTYGGNGQTNFQLPNFNGRTVLAPGTGPGLSPWSLGEASGTSTVTLLATQIPSHTHVLNAGVLSSPNPAQNVATPSTTALFGLSGPNNTYSDQTTPNTTMNAGALSQAGNGLPHENMQPYLALNYCIAVQGIFPARN